VFLSEGKEGGRKGGREGGRESVRRATFTIMLHVIIDLQQKQAE